MWEAFIDTILMLQSSLIAILQNWQLFAYLLILQCAFAALTAWFLSDIPMDRESLSILSFLGGILGLTLFSLVIVLLKIIPSMSLGMITGAAAFLVIIWFRRYLFTLASSDLVRLAIFFLFILLLRMIFIQGLLVPPYVDSVQHLQIVQDFLHPDRPPQAFYRLSPDLGHYYHFGFHAIAALLSGATSTTPEQTIMLLGQYFQTLAILAVYPLARILAKDAISAWSVMIIAGLILSIPAYASNWGKYPAIASLTGISFGISLFLIYTKNKPLPSKKFWWLVSLATVSTICLHSRSFFVLLLSLLAIVLYTRSNFIFEKLEINDNNENKTLVVLLLTTMLQVFTLALKFQTSLLLYFLEFVFWGLSILAFYSDFMLVWTLITFVLVMGLSLLLPMPFSFLPIRYSMLFDRPFLVVFFYLPASFLIWKGLEGGLRLLAKNKFELWRRWLFTSVLAFGLVNAIFIQNHHPSNCCVFMDDNDLFSFQWMKENIPEDMLVGIAATGKPGNLLPADGGAWIELFTGIPTRKLDSSADFINTNWKLCVDNVTYLYVDSLGNSFDEYNLKESGAEYRFGLGNVRIYQLNCEFLK
jgi:hypothetical protein